MKIEQLGLIAFGPFTNTTIDLNGGPAGFHLVYGANEAGKSSALRALRYVLYGIPERSTDNFVHPYARLRLGAVLRSADGRVLAFVRRKGRGNTLREADDTSVLDESELQRFLGGVTADLFTTMFGIGHEDLVRGGQDIISGGGDVGRLVFAAGSGIVNLREIQNELQTEADELFRPSGQKKKINAALERLNHNRKALREAQLPGQAWVQHDQALRNALDRKHIVETRLIAHQKKLSRLQRIRDALPFISKRQELLGELKEYVAVVLLPQDFSEKRRNLVTKLDIALKEKVQAQNNIGSIEQTIAALDMLPGVLDNAVLIEELHRDLGSQHKASKDRVGLETRRNTLQGEAKEILCSLRDDLTLEEAEKLRIKKAETVRIQELSARYEKLIDRNEITREKLPELIQEIDQLDKALQALDLPRPVDALQLEVAAAAEYGPLEKQNRSDISEIQAALKKIEQEQHKLGLGETAVAALAHLPAPSLETIHVLEDQFDATGRRQAEIHAEIEKVKKTLAEVERQIAAHRLEQEVPTEIDLKKARELRDHGWRLIACKLQDEPVSEKDLHDYLTGTPDAQNITEAFEKNLHYADAVADRLRREAGRVAAKARLLADQVAGSAQLQNLQKDLAVVQAERSKISDEWTTLWQPLGITPRTPKEMRRWAQDFETLIEKLKDSGGRQTKAAVLQQKIEAQRTGLIQSLAPFGRTADFVEESLNRLVKRAQAIIEDEAKLLQKRAQLARDKALKEKELAAAKTRLDTNASALKAWQQQWEAAMQPLGLEAGALPAQATAVMEELKNLFDKLKEANILQKRIDGIDLDAEKFAQKVNGLVEVIARDLTGRPGDEAALELHYRLKRSRDAFARQETLTKQLETERECRKQATDDILQVETRLKGMCAEAGCAHIGELSEAEKRSAQRRRIEADLKTAEERLRQLSGGTTVEEFAAEAAREDPDSIGGEIERLMEDIQNLNQEKSELDQTIGSQRTELSKMDGSALAAELAEETQLLLGGLTHDVEHYARLKIATRLLSRAIERYSDKSQGPILRRASTLFNQITVGSFGGIRAEYYAKGRHVIVGVRQRNGETVAVEAMSDGTTDQLYLALRLAGLEMYLEKNEPIPFIVDDILIKFDNERAAATLQALAEISHKTQVIFFTHHRHLVELAQKNIDPAVLIQHTL
ncbi:MAG: AAA family ATPase [Proteobacteria bacterium]|nr:AAA family ATPase [Pseudomonadota bacterium]